MEHYRCARPKGDKNARSLNSSILWINLSFYNIILSTHFLGRSLGLVERILDHDILSVGSIINSIALTLETSANDEFGIMNRRALSSLSGILVVVER